MSKPYILLADDELTVIDSLLNQLRTHLGSAYNYETAQSVEEAREVIEYLSSQGLNLKLIVSDWLMPPGNSVEWLIDMKKSLPTTNVVMLSGYADEKSIEKAFAEANLKAFIRKPWDEEELLKELRKWL